MILIKTPRVSCEGGRARLLFDVLVDGEKRTVWFEVDERYGYCLCHERGDAMVVGLLNWAMREGHGIESEAPVTDELLFGVNEVLVPSLYKSGRHLKAIRVSAPMAPAIGEGTEVGTGCSCGVDSFDTIRTFTETPYPTLRLSTLCINDVGAFNECYADYGEERARDDVYAEASIVAHETGLPLVRTASNFASTFPMNHSRTHTYSSCFAVLAMQKLWQTYFYSSSGYDYNAFSLTDNDERDSANYELLSLQCFSTSTLRILSAGGAKTRLEKTKNIIDYPLAQKHLHVCTSQHPNCGVCPKCRRTLVTLDLLGALDDFSDVFDVEYYRAHRGEYLAWLCERHLMGDIMNEPVYQAMRQAGTIRTATLARSMPKGLAKATRKRLSENDLLREAYHRVRRGAIDRGR